MLAQGMSPYSLVAGVLEGKNYFIGRAEVDAVRKWGDSKVTAANI
jgi:hypothetical protein